METKLILYQLSFDTYFLIDADEWLCHDKQRDYLSVGAEVGQEILEVYKAVNVKRTTRALKHDFPCEIKPTTAYVCITRDDILV